MGVDDLEEVAQNIAILIHEELETQHLLDGHPTPVDDCRRCRSHSHATR